MDMEKLYRDIILENYKSPKNKGIPSDFKIKRLTNTSCGDDVSIGYKIENNLIKDLKHEGVGCSICCSSASVVTELLKNKNCNEAKRLINIFYNLTNGITITKDEEKELKEAIAYKGVSSFPARIKCAQLAWKAIDEILGGDDNE